MEDQKDLYTKKNQEKDGDNNIPNYEMQKDVSKALYNPFLLASLTNTMMMNLSSNGLFQIP